MRKHVNSLLIVAAIIAMFAGYRFITGPRGFRAVVTPLVVLGDEPLQVAVSIIEPIEIELKKGRAILTPFAYYAVAARIGGRKRYGGEWPARLARYDLLLLWGELATQPIDDIEFKQEMRWYSFRLPRNSPRDLQYVSRHSANNHMIPGSSNLRRAISRLDEGDIVLLEGYLVDISGEYDGGPIYWNSSRTREDGGNGACEVFLLTSLTRDGKVYR
ncbi:MAG: hypothetical protein P9M14_07455 [Candidatus Alcyoniella australis]|nr:hypothetical protein [Candidatus Alcyoniella australis]